MKPLGIKSQAVVGKIQERKPFTNKTNYYVGKAKIIDGKPMIITAITYLTQGTVAIYAMDAGTPMKLEEYKDFQRRREDGQINVYLPGRKVLEVENI